MVRQDVNEVAADRRRLRCEQKFLFNRDILNQDTAPVLQGGATFIDKVTRLTILCVCVFFNEPTLVSFSYHQLS